MSSHILLFLAILIDHARRKIDIAIFVGTKDQYFPLTAVRATQDELEKKEFSVALTETPDHDHWYYDLAPRINRIAWDFPEEAWARPGSAI